MNVKDRKKNNGIRAQHGQTFSLTLVPEQFSLATIDTAFMLSWAL